MVGAASSEPAPAGPDAEAVVRALTTGVAAVGLPDDDEAPTPCSDWSARDIVRHLEAVAGAYVLWVAGAIGGRMTPLLVGGDLAAWNAALLERLPDRSTWNHHRRFRELASDHRRLVTAHPESPMKFTPHGTVWTVLEHAGVAAIEWHVHAWDLAQAAGHEHSPDPVDAATLARAWSAVLTPASERALPDGDPWPAVLKASGRTP